MSWIAEFITGAAWQDPPYSPLYNRVSHLGLTGRRRPRSDKSPTPPRCRDGHRLGHLRHPPDHRHVPPARPRTGARPIIIISLAVLAGAGVLLVGIFQGSNANAGNGLIAFHTVGARGVMLAGNLMAIAVGAGGTRIGLTRDRSIAGITLGTAGLIAFRLFMTDVFTGWLGNIGLFERAVIYPIMIGHALFGSSVAATQRHRATHPLAPLTALAES
ncbi:DUF998 domain-containing protein [Streptomyces sp. NPDC054804]